MKKAQTDTAKSRSLVLGANDKKMFVSGNKPEVKKPVSSAAAPKGAAPKPAKKPTQNASLTGMPSERAGTGPTTSRSLRSFRSLRSLHSLCFLIRSTYERRLHLHEERCMDVVVHGTVQKTLVVRDVDEADE